LNLVDVSKCQTLQSVQHWVHDTSTLQEAYETVGFLNSGREREKRVVFVGEIELDRLLPEIVLKRGVGLARREAVNE